LRALAVATTGRLRRTVYPSPRSVVAFAPGGTLVATGCSGLTDSTFPPRPHPDVRKCGVVAVWDVQSGKRLFRWDTFGDLVKLAFSPDGTLLAAARLFETDDGLALHEVRVWDVSTGRLVKALDRCHSFDFSPDGRQLAVLSRSKCALYEVKDWAKETLVKPLGGAIGVSFAADGQSLIGVVKGEGKFRLRLASLDGGWQADACPNAVAAARSAVLSRRVAADGTLALPRRRQYHHLGCDDARHPLATEQRRRGDWPSSSLWRGLLAASCGKRRRGIEHERRSWRFTFEKEGFRTYLSCPEAVFRRPDPTRFCFSPDGNAILVGAYGGILRIPAADRSGVLGIKWFRQRSQLPDRYQMIQWESLLVD
jgi:WD40 repeat protein